MLQPVSNAAMAAQGTTLHPLPPACSSHVQLPACSAMLLEAHVCGPQHQADPSAWCTAGPQAARTCRLDRLVGS